MKLGDFIVMIVLFWCTTYTVIVCKEHIIKEINNNPRFKVYYEYNVIDHDTIAVDTIYIPLKIKK